MMPHIRGRPVTMERYPAGIDGERVLSEGRLQGVPGLARARRGAEEGWHRAPPAHRRHAIAALGGQPELHHAARLDVARADLYQPDICVFDLDPAEEVPDVLRATAIALRDLLDEIGLPSWVKTSGSKGFHIVVPLDGKLGFGDVSGFAHAVGTVLVKHDPEHLTQEFHKVDRAGRILVDTGRNGYSATFAAPYAVRAKPGAPVSAPCTWEEIERGEVGPRTFTLRTMAQRIDEVGDLWADMRKRRRSLRRAIGRVRQLQLR